MEAPSKGTIAAIVGAGAGVTALANDALRKKVATWLRSVFIDDWLHKSNIVLGAVLNGTNTVANIHRFGNIGKALTKAVGAVGSATTVLTEGKVASGAFQEMNAIFDELKNPNIEGIPIHAVSEIESQDVEVAQHVVIQQDSFNKDQRVDNAVPKLRTWSIQGYLMSNPWTGTDGSLIIKPTLLLQRKLLQMYVDSRRPVLFKTHDNRFFKVLITHFDTQYTVNSLNSLQVSLQLVEFKTLDLESQSLSLTILEPRS